MPGTRQENGVGALCSCGVAAQTKCQIKHTRQTMTHSGTPRPIRMALGTRCSAYQSQGCRPGGGCCQTAHGTPAAVRGQHRTCDCLHRLIITGRLVRSRIPGGCTPHENHTKNKIQRLRRRPSAHQAQVGVKHVKLGGARHLVGARQFLGRVVQVWERVAWGVGGQRVAAGAICRQEQGADS